MAEISPDRSQSTAPETMRIRDEKNKMRAEVEGIMDRNKKTKEDLETAYNLDLSRLKNDLDQKLVDYRMTHLKQLEEEKVNGNDEIEKVRKSYQEQIAKYKENSEKNLENLKRKYSQMANEMDRRYQKG